MNSWIFLFLCTLTISFVNSLEFSQFYLPQCCYIAPPGNEQQQEEQFPVHHHQPSPSHRHDIKARKAEPSHIVSLENSNSNNNAENSQTQSATTVSTTKNRASKKSASRLYRYIIPLKKSELMSPAHEVRDPQKTEETTPMPVVLMRENGMKMRKNLQNDMKAEELSLDREKLLSSAQIETELTPSMTTKIKNMLTNNNHSNNSNSTLPSIESILFSQNMTLESMSKFKRNAGETGEGAEQDGENDNPPPTKMPPNWVTNLRRALYQSMESLLTKQSKGDNSKSSSQEETIQAKSSTSGNPYQQSSHEVHEGNNMLWQKLRDANFTMIEPVTRHSTTLPQTLYLPNGQGPTPIASGVVVNTVNGMQLRMASELNRLGDPLNPSDSGANDCSCHLIHNGEILMAYWSVSRIINEKGQPALQYLIYPLPYNTPTPPVMIPFNGGKNLAQSSPYDPLPNLHQDYGKVFQQQGLRQNQRHGAGRKVIGGQRPPFENYQQLPQYLQELPLNLPVQNPQNHVEFPPGYEQAFKQQQQQQFNQLPGPIHGPTGQGPPDGGYRGVVIENEHGYTPEFINIYKQAVQNHIQHKDHYEKGPGFPGTSGNFPQPIPLPPTHPSPDIYGTIDKSFSPQSPPSHIQLFDGKAPSFPKSIQDILSPFPPTISLPHNIPGLSQHPNFENDVKIHQQQQQNAQHGLDNGLQEFNHGLGNPHHFHPENPPIIHHQELPGESPPKGYDINNYYSFVGGAKGHHYLHPQSGGGFGNRPEPGTGDFPHHYHHEINNQRRGPQHAPYPDDRRHSSLINSNNRPGNRFIGNDDEIRHYRQQIPPRHRSEKYSRPNEKRFNQDGSYILNF